ncbi:MAG TPA: TonB-dependent receptor [Acidobacteriota bacterium]|nr:TonB-dependent receptor [Acidobacteriota bacterium]
MRLTRFTVCAVIICLFALIPVMGQINTGSIAGTITDQGGGIIPGATVTITNTELGVKLTVISNDAGNFVAQALRPGIYEVVVEMTGFKSAVSRNITVRVQDRVNLPIVLEVGEVNETIEVVERAGRIDTETAQQGTVIEAREIVDLPLDGRRYSDLILLTPGAVPAPGTRSNPREARLNVDGNFSLQNYFALNGVDNNTFTTNAQERSPQAVSPPPDALQHFKVQTRTYDAEFGWSQGAVINAELKSGTNAFHGSGFWFHRNDNLNANNFFANQAGIGKAEELRHQYGGIIGGPIIPDRTFFFADYQRTEARKGTTAAGTVPTPSMKDGIFTGARDLVIQRDSEGNPFFPEIVPCIDEDNDVLLLNATRTDGLPCADPAGVALGQLYPDPNNGTFGFVAAPDVPLEQNSFDIRIDHNINDNNLLYGTYSFLQTETIVERGPFPDPIATGGFSGNSYLRGQLAALTWNDVISPNIVNSLRFGFNRIFSDTAPLAEEGNAGPDFGLTNLPGAFAFGLPPIRVSGYTLLGTSEWRPQYQVSQVYQVLDNLSWVKGDHTFKFGFEFKRAINNFLDIKAPNGRYIISDFWTNDGFANLLLGNVQRVEQTTALVPHNYTDGYMAYAQDSWSITPDVKLNYGLRYEYFTPLIERDNLTSNFVPDANGGRGALVTANPGPIPPVPCDFDCVQRTDGEGIFGRTLINPDRNNFAPRVGLSVRVSDNMVVRGGYAIFYQALDRMGSSAVLQLNPPQLVEFRGVESNFNEPPQILLRDGFPAASTEFDPLTIDLRGRDVNETAPFSQQYSLSTQFQLGRDYLLDLAYVGQTTDDIRKLRRLNQGILQTPGTDNIVFPFPDWANLSDFLRSDGTANYNSFQLQLRKGFSNGVAFNLSYTWGKALGDTQDNLSAGAGASNVRPQNTHNLDADYGRLVFDQNHRFVANWVWELPFGPGKNHLNDGPIANILGGWQFNGIWSSTSGAPLGVSASDVSGTRSQNYRADCVGDPSGPETVDQFFNTNAFRQPSAFTFGSCGVASLSGWPHHVFDLSLFKNFKLPWNEESRLQFRTEFFNAFNTPQFSSPSTNVNSGQFGRTTSVFDPEKEARVIQFGLKLIF